MSSLVKCMGCFYNTKKKLKIFWLLLFSLFFSINSYTQNKRPTGLVLEDEVYDTIPKVHRSDGSKYNLLDLRKSLKKYCPKPGNQGETGACVAWATGYAGLTICRAIRDSICDMEAITEKANSAAFIFNQIKEKEDCSIGAKFSKAFSLLKKKGDCLAIHFDSDNPLCNKKPNHNLFKEASQFKIKDYARIFDKEDSGERKREEVRMALSQDNPVIVGMKITDSFYDLNAENSFWQPDENEVLLDGGHAMVVIAYDHVRKEVELMNSFGTNWGNAGFFKMGYRDFSRMAMYGFQMVIDDKDLIAEKESNWFWDRLVYGKQNNRKLFQGQCSFLIFNENLEFENTKVSFNNITGIYETDKEWTVGDDFQLQIKNITKGSFLYAFSINAKGKIDLHFPKKNNLTAFISSNQQVITIPNEGRGLRLTTLGDDYLCILFSKNKIEKIEEYFPRIGNAKGSIKERINNAFELQEDNQISVIYDNSTMRFEDKEVNLSNRIIPVLLKITATK